MEPYMIGSNPKHWLGWTGKLTRKYVSHSVSPVPGVSYEEYMKNRESYDKELRKDKATRDQAS